MLALGFVSPTFAIDASVTFVGGAENFVFHPGSDWSEVDLFANLKDAMPGDQISEEILVRNSATNFSSVKIYLRADPHDETTNPLSPTVSATETIASMTDFLSQLRLRVYQDGSLIYDASPDQLSTLNDNLLLGDFLPNTSTTLRLELSVPANLSNQYMHRAGEIDWIFTAEESTSRSSDTSDSPTQPNPPDTGVNTVAQFSNTLATHWPLVLTASLTTIGATILILRRQRK